MDIKIEVVDQNENVKMSKTIANRAYLDYLNHYQAGDKIRVTVDEPNQYLIVQLDESLNPSLVYLHDTVWEYIVPIDEKAREAYPSNVFLGDKHYLSVRLAEDNEIYSYQNLALNNHDQKQDSKAYPHAVANVETRNDSTFFARNAIDGVLANEDHGPYPYQSWGINRQADACLRVDFGRLVEIDKVALVLRGDYPHDSYWTQVTLEFSDGSTEIVSLDKKLEPQYVELTPRKIEWVELKNLIKAKDDSPFPALTQIEVYGQSLR